MRECVEKLRWKVSNSYIWRVPRVFKWKIAKVTKACVLQLQFVRLLISRCNCSLDWKSSNEHNRVTAAPGRAAHCVSISIVSVSVHSPLWQWWVFQFSKTSVREYMSSFVDLDRRFGTWEMDPWAQFLRRIQLRERKCSISSSRPQKVRETNQWNKICKLSRVFFMFLL